RPSAVATTFIARRPYCTSSGGGWIRLMRQDRPRSSSCQRADGRTGRPSVLSTNRGRFLALGGAQRVAQPTRDRPGRLAHARRFLFGNFAYVLERDYDSPSLHRTYLTKSAQAPAVIRRARLRRPSAQQPTAGRACTRSPGRYALHTPNRGRWTTPCR